MEEYRLGWQGNVRWEGKGCKGCGKVFYGDRQRRQWRWKWCGECMDRAVSAQASGELSGLKERVRSLEVEKVEGYKVVARLQEELAASPDLQERRLHGEMVEVAAQLQDAREDLQVMDAEWMEKVGARQQEVDGLARERKVLDRQVKVMQRQVQVDETNLEGFRNEVETAVLWDAGDVVLAGDGVQVMEAVKRATAGQEGFWCRGLYMLAGGLTIWGRQF